MGNNLLSDYAHFAEVAIDFEIKSTFCNKSTD